MHRRVGLLLVLVCTIISATKVVKAVDMSLQCQEGYKYDVREGCVDVNECMEMPCKKGQVCRNLMGSYTCLCPRGYRLNKSSKECEDVNECELGYCGREATCINTDGSYTCNCPTGMKKIGRFCRDINECIGSPCSEHEYCINTRGSYKCMCRGGFEKVAASNDTIACVDIDECAQGMCQAYGETCVNTPGSYQCTCQEGFVRDEMTGGRYCKDLDECELDACPQNSECINTVASFYCRCHRGFTMHEGRCVDETDCMQGEGRKCQYQCVDTPGSFQCRCPPGYEQSDFACIDINECDQPGSEMACNESELCINTHGGYRCVDKASCPHEQFYKKVTRTDEFGRRQFTTNTCRRRCRHLKDADADMYRKCKRTPMSVASHYIDITSRLPLSRRVFRIKMKSRRRRQKYEFSITEGDRTKFGLKQISKWKPSAYLMLKQELTGPSEYLIKVDMTTYNRKGKKRDNRMVSITVFVSEYEF